MREKKKKKKKKKNLKAFAANIISSQQMVNEYIGNLGFSSSRCRHFLSFQYQVNLKKNASPPASRNSVAWPLQWGKNIIIMML